MPRDAPLPSISAELWALQRAAGSVSDRAQRRAREQLNTHRAYQRLFLTDGGHLREEARMVLDDIMEEAAIGLASPSLDHAELAAKEGKRRLALYIIGRLQMTEERLRNLEGQLIQEEDNAG